MTQRAKRWLKRSKLRSDFDKPYFTTADFERTVPEHKRMVVIGCAGSGKSTLLNKLAGCEKVWVDRTDTHNDTDHGSFEWKASPIFESGHSLDSVTKCSAFANLKYMGRAERPFIAVDTPGHDDPNGGRDIVDEAAARDFLDGQAADLHAKLRAMGRVHAIVVVHNDVHSNRLNPATYELLRKVDEMFATHDTNGSQTAGTDGRTTTSVWEHVVVCYSKCDADSRGWRDGLAEKRRAMQAALRAAVPSCTLDVPVLALSGVAVGGAGNAALDRGFEALWDFLQAAPPLPTAGIRKFAGLSARVGALAAARDAAVRCAEARRDFPAVSGNFLTLVVLLIVRSCLLPVLDVPGVLDEAALFGFLAYRTGLYKVADWAAVLWDDVLLKGYIVPAAGWVGLGETVGAWARVMQVEPAAAAPAPAGPALPASFSAAPASAQCDSEEGQQEQQPVKSKID